VRGTQRIDTVTRGISTAPSGTDGLLTVGADIARKVRQRRLVNLPQPLTKIKEAEKITRKIEKGEKLCLLQNAKTN